MKNIIKIWAKGNPGNIMMMYLSAIKLMDNASDVEVVNVEIPIFDINIPNVGTDGLGLHNREITNSRQFGYIPSKGLRHAAKLTNASFISLEGFCQHVDNFPELRKFNYEKFFPPLPGENGGKENDIVINIRGGEVLQGIHPHYCLLPPEFYNFVISKTNKNPIFYGQLDDSPYMRELRERFPDARFEQSRGAREDFDFIRKSKHIIPCLSTFSWMASWLSKATSIHFPVAGVLNPMQHNSSMLVPLHDERYHFYLFPNFYALHVDHYKDYIDPIRDSWEPIDKDSLLNIINNIKGYNEIKNLDDFICSLDCDEYISMYPDEKRDFEVFGKIGVFNNYINDGFFNKKRQVKLDVPFYTRNYPQVGRDISVGKYPNAEFHYAVIGHHLGLKKHP